MAYNALNNLIDAYIYPNGVQAITGSILNNVLKAMVSQLGGGYNLMGVAAPASSPAVNDEPLAYFAATAGTYTNFDGIVLAAGEVAVLLTSGNGSWSKQTIYNVPTGTADLANTAGFITSAVNSLVNYYTKTEIDTALAGYTTTAALATALADYYNKAAIDAQMATRYTKSEVDTKLGDYYRKTETYDKDEVDSIVAALSRQEYIVAWDGSSAPVVADIPAGVTVTYSGTPYTGTLAASADTVNKIYMVWNGTAYDMYGTSQDGGYSWIPMGTTSVDLSQYATKVELQQLDQDIREKYGDYHDTVGFIRVVIDKDGRLLYGVKDNGDFIFGSGVPTQVREYILAQLDLKVDKEDGKGLSSNDYTDGEKEIVNIQELLDNPVWMNVTIDKEYKILEGINISGERVENIPVRFPSATFSNESSPLWSGVIMDEQERIVAGIKRDGEVFISRIESPDIEGLKKAEEYYHGINPHSCIVSFIDDDTGIHTPEIWGRIISETGIKMGFACVTGIMGGEVSDYAQVFQPMSIQDLRGFYDAGHEVYSHSWSHPAFYLDTTTPEMIQEQCQKSRDWLNNNGFTRNSDVIVYPGGLGITRTGKISVVRRNFRYGVDTVFNDGNNPNGVNPEPLYNDLSIFRCNGDTMTLSELIETVDVAIAERKLLVIMNHSYELYPDKENQIAKIISFIQYIQNSGAIILPLEEALHEIYGWH